MYSGLCWCLSLLFGPLYWPACRPSFYKIPVKPFTISVALWPPHISNYFIWALGKYSAFRFKFSALKVYFPAYCAIHSAENLYLGRKIWSETRSSYIQYCIEKMGGSFPRALSQAFPSLSQPFPCFSPICFRYYIFSIQYSNYLLRQRATE